MEPTIIPNLPKWWAYRHINGSMHLKRYDNPNAVSDAHQDISIRKVTESFEAATEEEAKVIAARLLRSFN